MIIHARFFMIERLHTRRLQRILIRTKIRKRFVQDIIYSRLDVSQPLKDAAMFKKMSHEIVDL